MCGMTVDPGRWSRPLRRSGIRQINEENLEQHLRNFKGGLKAVAYAGYHATLEGSHVRRPHVMHTRDANSKKSTSERRRTRPLKR